MPVEASKKFHLLSENLDDYLVRSEDSIPNLKKDLKKEFFRLLKYQEKKLDIAIVYMHGYSASPQEVKPVPEKIANKLNDKSIISLD